MKPVFRNGRMYELSVPLPSGASKILKTGQCVQGDFFVTFWKGGMPVDLLKEEEVAALKKEDIVYTENAPAENLQQLLEVKMTPHVVPTDDSKLNTEQALEKALGTADKTLPTLTEVDRMSAEDLRKTADQLGLTTVGTRNELMKAVKAKIKG